MKNKRHHAKKPTKIKYTLHKKVLNLLLEKPNQDLNSKQISSKLDLKTRKQKDDLLKSIQALLAQKRIIERELGKFKINQEKNYVVGKIDITQSGSAFVIVEGLERDIFVQKEKIKNALEADVVRVFVYPKKNKSSRAEGEVVGIIQRNRTDFVGVFQEQPSGKYGFVESDKNQLQVDFYIPKSKFGGAKSGEKVLVRMNDWPEDADSPFGEITKVLGDPTKSSVEMHSILLEYDLPLEFPPEVEAEAQAIDTRITEEEIAKRRDMRAIPTLTIDPKDAKDFDDALSIQKLENGNWEIGVHIADVSHYVQLDSLLEQEAFKRATSVYLVDRVVPMLPEILSNVACSLRPNEEKYTFSGVFEITEKAQIVNSWFGRTVIYSDKRFTYQQAQDLIEGKDGEMKEEILILDSLAKILRKKRLDTGAISFDKSEIKFELDEDLNPKSIYVKESKEANHLIEEFMLLCNRKVSEFISLDKQGEKSNKTFVYRIHDMPDEEKLMDLSLYIKQFGYKIDIQNRKIIAQSLNKLLADVKGKPEANMIETLVLRTMSKAKYTTQNIGHYGLSFQYYSHFTSPIRRYPDVIAHRLLQHYLDGKKSPNTSYYEEKCEHSSARERLATEAERESIKYMQVKFMQQYVGQEFYGYITGIQDYGIFVEVTETRSEGMIRLKNITLDSFYYDSKTLSIVGRKTGQTYQLGDQVMIKVIKADVQKKQLDFALLQ